MQVSEFRLHVLRGMYIFIAVGLGLVIWPEILLPADTQANAHTVVSSLLGALGLLCLLGLRYPLKMLPLLIFELVWKLIWVLAFALPMSLDTGLDAYAKDTLFACAIGIMLVPLVMPWGYVMNTFLKAKAEPWRRG
ncbi:hypothetical protein [Alkalimonas amylolytica]|uniref:Uncharacterized protein n=1 Tax=Alkalimonas amylolytica TaxID=152573 RepID=A0A1H4BHQ8_ALKAM|nr:hypothetical protein [Alkalimonas amylolytica]SEA47548.1 hypothetical protein SAMN04488051_103363 [Alkalimonas amylolytica]